MPATTSFQWNPSSARAMRICAISLSVLLDRHFSVCVLAICRYNTGSFNRKTHRFFLFSTSDSLVAYPVADRVISRSERVFVIGAQCFNEFYEKYDRCIENTVGILYIRFIACHVTRSSTLINDC